MTDVIIYAGCLVAATMSILLTLYYLVRDSEPQHHGAPLRRVRFWNFR